MVAEQAGHVDLQQRAVLDVRLEPVEVAGGALGVGEQQAVAEAGQAGDGGVEDVVEALERALEQQPRRVLGALGDQRELFARRA